MRFIAEKTYAVCPPKRVAFLGLGVMGYPMAAHLARAGHTVCVYNRHADKARQWVAQLDGTFAATPREAAAGADMVFCCVGNDDDLRSVVLGEQGALAGMAEGAVLVDHTTARPWLRASCMRLPGRMVCNLWMRPFRADRPERKTGN